jgi:hypothetical protein
MVMWWNMGIPQTDLPPIRNWIEIRLVYKTKYLDRRTDEKEQQKKQIPAAVAHSHFAVRQGDWDGAQRRGGGCQRLSYVGVESHVMKSRTSGFICLELRIFRGGGGRYFDKSRPRRVKRHHRITGQFARMRLTAPTGNAHDVCVISVGHGRGKWG